MNSTAHYLKASVNFQDPVLGILEMHGGSAQVVPVGRAALGLIAALRAFKTKHGACLVAMPGAVCHDVLVAVMEAGHRPFFCDVNPEDGLVPQSEWVRARELGSSIAIVVHLYGNSANVDRVKSIFTSPQCFVIDDAAQALGSKYKGKCVGTGGDVGLISFGMTKQINVGGAVMVIHDREIYRGISKELELMVCIDESVRRRNGAEFRDRLYRAKHQFLKRDNPSGFAGLLDSYRSALYPDFRVESFGAIQNALQAWPAKKKMLVAKANLWKEALRSIGVIPVGMGKGVVPWRFTCRKPGLTWQEQNRISELIRSQGVDVSNWYYPVNWYLREHAGIQLEGAKTLAREVFQFWVGEKKSFDDVNREIGIVSNIMKNNSA